MGYLTRRNRVALQAALECLREWDSTRYALRALHQSVEALELVGVYDVIDIARAIPGRYSSVHGWVPVGDPRILRARLALLIRAMLRADRNDFGPKTWYGCHCHCDGDRGGWYPGRITPLWELAEPTELR